MMFSFNPTKRHPAQKAVDFLLDSQFPVLVLSSSQSGKHSSESCIPIIIHDPSLLLNIYTQVHIYPRCPL